MPKIVPSLVMGASLMIATAASGATTAGTVTAVDTAKHTVTLSDGMVYTTSPTTDLTRLQVGYTIQVTFTASGTVNNVSALEILSPRQSGGY